MLEFKEAANNKCMLRVVQLGQECAIGMIDINDYGHGIRFYPLEGSYSSGDLKQIADKLDSLNGHTDGLNFGE